MSALNMTSFGTILVVEDSLDDFALLQLAFRRSAVPVNICHVPDGSQALRYLLGEGDYGDRRKHPLPQLILSDLKMPTMDGLELLRWVRNHGPNIHVPFVMLSSSKQPEDVLRAYEQRVNSYLFKPGGLAELVELVGLMATYWLRANLVPGSVR